MACGSRGETGPDTSQIALVSVRDGAMRVLKSIEWGATRSIFFSPDGRYIAYSLPKAGTHDESNVLVMTVDGSRENTVVEHPSQNQIMGWSPDGSTLLFASDRNGALRLWTLPVSEGQSHGTPALVDSDIIVGSVPVSLGVTASGALYVGKFTQNMHVQVSPIDLTAGRLLADSAASPRVFVGFGGKPTWSADGKYLAYQSCPANCDRTGQHQDSSDGHRSGAGTADAAPLPDGSDRLGLVGGRPLTVGRRQ